MDKINKILKKQIKAKKVIYLTGTKIKQNRAELKQKKKNKNKGKSRRS